MCDFYDYDEMEQLHEERAATYVALVNDLNKAKANNDEKTAQKIVKKMARHLAEDADFEENASESGFDWY